MNDDYSNSQRTKSSNNNNNDYYQQHRNEYNAGYRQSTAQHQGQSSPLNYHERIFFNRGRNGAFEQIILIRSNCVARIVGKLNFPIVFVSLFEIHILRHTRF